MYFCVLLFTFNILLCTGHAHFRGHDLGVPPRRYFRSCFPAHRSPCWRALRESQHQ